MPCERCEGSGKEPLYRCPSKLVPQEWQPFFAVYGQLMKYNQPPSPDGTTTQTAWFLDALSVADAERATLRAEAEEIERRKAGHLSP